MTQPGSSASSRPAARPAVRAAFAATAAVIGAALALSITELALFFFYSQGGAPLINDFDPVLGHRLRAGVDQVHIWDGHDNVSRITINSLGLRGELPPAAKRRGETRVLVLGDSYAFGYGVGDGDTFSVVLERKLNAAAGGDGRFVVLNGGVSSYGTAQELLRYRELRASVEPDVVLLVFFVGNDVHDNMCIDYISLRPHHRFPCFGIEDGKLALISKPEEPKTVKKQPTIVGRIRNAAKGSQTYALLNAKLKTLLTTNPVVVRTLLGLGIDVRPEYVPHVVAGWYLPEAAGRGWEITSRLIDELASDVRADGARFALIVIPSRAQVVPEMLQLTKIMYEDEPAVNEFLSDPDRPQHALDSLGREHGFPVLDLTAVLKANDTSKLYYPTVAHWNEKGHEVVAEAIEQFLERERLVPESR